MAQRAVLVTGASRGIGRAVAEAFAGQGDRVAVHHRGSPGLAAQVLAGLPGDGHTVVRADLADAEAVRQMVDQAHADLGALAPTTTMSLLRKKKPSQVAHQETPRPDRRFSLGRPSSR